MPELLMDDGKSPITFKTFMAEVAEVATPEDMQVIDRMRLPIDNRNLICLLESEGEFDDRGSLTREDLEDAIKYPDQLPDAIPLFGLDPEVKPPKYMRAYIKAHKESHQLFPGLTPIDQLTWLFYDEMIDVDNDKDEELFNADPSDRGFMYRSDSKCDFLREWYEFDRNLRNVVAGINIKKNLPHIEAIGTERDRPGVFTIVGDNELAEAVLKSPANDFGMAGRYPWIEKVLALSKSTLTEMEKGLDDIRWEMLNELSMFNAATHDVEAIAAVAQKVLIVERWLKLEPKVGRERMDKLVEEMMGSFVMPAGFE